MIIRNSIWSH